MGLAPPADINLKLLRAFDAVARHCSFSKAAVELGRSQATISAQVHELEQQLQVKLLERTTRQVTLTEAGELLARDVEVGLRSIVAGLAAVSNLSEARRSRVFIACVPSLSSVRLPAILASYRLYDNITRIDVEELTSAEIVAAIADGKMDFGIGPCSLPLPAEVAFTVAVVEPICLVLPAGHPMQNMNSVPLQALTTLALITLSGAVLLQVSLEETMHTHGLQLSSQTEVRQVQTAIGMVRAGIGAAVVPRLALPDILTPDIMALSIGDPPLSREIGIITRHGKPLQPAGVQLARHVRGSLARAVGIVSNIENSVIS